MSFSVFCGGAKVMSLLKFRVLMSSLMSRTIGKTEFSSTTKNRTNSVSQKKNISKLLMENIHYFLLSLILPPVNWVPLLHKTFIITLLSSWYTDLTEILIKRTSNLKSSIHATSVYITCLKRKFREITKLFVLFLCVFLNHVKRYSNRSCLLYVLWGTKRYVLLKFIYANMATRNSYGFPILYSLI